MIIISDSWANNRKIHHLIRFGAARCADEVLYVVVTTGTVLSALILLDSIGRLSSRDWRTDIITNPMSSFYPGGEQGSKTRFIPRGSVLLPPCCVQSRQNINYWS